MSFNGDDQALADVTNKLSNVQFNKEEQLHRVKEAKWGDRQEYDYAKYTAGPHDKTSTASVTDQPPEDTPDWAANAAKYEWAEDYGDVGPAHDELETMLFGDEHKMVEGEEFSK